MLVISSIHGMQFFNSPSSSSKSILRFISKTDAYSTKCQLGSDQWYFAWGSLRAGFFKDSPSTLIDSALYMFWFQYGLCFWMHCDYVTITDGNFNNNIDMLIFTESVRKIIRWGTLLPLIFSMSTSVQCCSMQKWSNCCHCQEFSGDTWRI